jgi:hypothetical protein
VLNRGFLSNWVLDIEGDWVLDRGFLSDWVLMRVPE